MKTTAKLLILALLSVVALTAEAVNKIPVKPDGANAAPLTVFGTPSNGVAIGTTAQPASTQLLLVPLTKSTTGLVETAATGQTADFVKISSEGATSPTFRIDKNGALIENAQVTVAPLTPSTTALIVISTASPAADIVDVSTVGATIPTFAISSSGFVSWGVYTKAVIDTLVPQRVGQHITCSNCTIPYVDCTSTGTLVAQFAVQFTSANYKGTGQVLRPGCGTNE